MRLWHGAKKKLEQMISADKASKTILVVEGNHEGLVTKASDGSLIGAAERYGAVLQGLDKNAQITITRPHFAADPAPPVHWPDIKGVVFTGAGVYWQADADEAAPARKIMEAAFARSLPVFGSCYGMQLGVAVLGGRMQANPLGPEIAIARDIQINDAGQKHTLYRKKPARFDALCMHRDDVLDAGQGLSVLSGNAHCAIQAVAAKTPDICFWGVQYHPELHFSDIARYLERSDIEGFSKTSDAIGLNAPAGLSKDEIVADFHALNKEQYKEEDKERYKEEDEEALKERYSLSPALLKRSVHECELSNWLASF